MRKSFQVFSKGDNSVMKNENPAISSIFSEILV